MIMVRFMMAMRHMLVGHLMFPFDIRRSAKELAHPQQERCGGVVSKKRAQAHHLIGGFSDT